MDFSFYPPKADKNRGTNPAIGGRLKDFSSIAG